MRNKEKITVAVVDATYVLTEAYYKGLPEEVLKAKSEEEKIEAYKLLEKNSDGKYIGAIRGLFSVIFDAVDRLNPTHITVVWGTSRKSNVRKEIYPNYKADTNGMDEPLREQFKTAQVLLAPLVKQFTSNKYEAIDLAGTIANNLKDRAEVNILAGNSNYLQLADISNVYLKTSIADRLIEEYGLNTEELPKGFFKYNESNIKYVKDLDADQILHFNSLVGVPSSGIPGVKGVGATTALPLVKHFGTIDNLYKVLENRDAKELTSVWKTINVRNPYNKLIANKENAFISKRLLTINKEVYIDTEEFNGMENTITLDKVANELSKVGLLSEIYVSGINESIKATNFLDLISFEGTTSIRPVKNNFGKFTSLELPTDYNIESELLSSADIEDNEKDFYSLKVSAPSILLNNDWDYIKYEDDYDNDDYDDDYEERHYEEDDFDDIDDGGVNCEVETVLAKTKSASENQENANQNNNEVISLIETIIIKKYKCNSCNNVFELSGSTPVNFCVYCGSKNSSNKEQLIDNLEDTGMKIDDIKINSDIESVMEYI